MSLFINLFTFISYPWYFFQWIDFMFNRFIRGLYLFKICFNSFWWILMFQYLWWFLPFTFGFLLGWPQNLLYRFVNYLFILFIVILNNLRSIGVKIMLLLLIHKITLFSRFLFKIIFLFWLTFYNLLHQMIFLAIFLLIKILCKSASIGWSFSKFLQLLNKCSIMIDSWIIIISLFRLWNVIFYWKIHYLIRISVISL